MRSCSVLWTSRTDHAGIVAQLQVEKLLASKGKRRGTDKEIATALAEGEKNKLVRQDKVLECVWEYKEEQGGAITMELGSLGLWWIEVGSASPWIWH